MQNELDALLDDFAAACSLSNECDNRENIEETRKAIVQYVEEIERRSAHVATRLGMR